MNKNITSLIAGVAVLGCISAQAVDYATVWYSGGYYYSNINKHDTQRASSFTDAVIRAVGIGNRNVTIKCGGTLTKTVRLRGNTTVTCSSGDRISKGSSYDGFYAYRVSNVKVQDLWMESGGYDCIRFSRCSNTAVNDCTLRNGGGGIRIDSDSSKPWTRKVSGCTIANINTKGTSGHAVETYGVDNYTVRNITSEHLSDGCGLLINYGHTGTIGTVYGNDCCRYGNGHGGGYYAAMRFANNCDGSTVDSVVSRYCGRGLFTCTGSKNIVVKNVNIRYSTSHAILLQEGSNNKVQGGDYWGTGLIDNCPGSYIHATHHSGS